MAKQLKWKSSKSVRCFPAGHEHSTVCQGMATRRNEAMNKYIAKIKQEWERSLLVVVGLLLLAFLGWLGFSLLILFISLDKVTAEFHALITDVAGLSSDNLFHFTRRLSADRARYF